MTITILGDFADPLSFLASQRVEQIRSLGLHDIHWLAVEGDRGRPMTGRPLDEATSEAVQRLSLPGEAVPAADLLVPNSRAATAAYAESVTDRVPDAVRRALFDALWVHGRNIGDPDVIRTVVFTVLNPDPPSHDIDWRVRANELIVPLGDPDPFTGTRRLGFVVSMGRGPLTAIGQRRVDAWRRQWHQRGAPEFPLLLTDLGEAFSGPLALDWLADQLPHPDRAANTAIADPVVLPAQGAPVGAR